MVSYIGGNVSKPGITADLEAIGGYSGIQLFHGPVGSGLAFRPDPIPERGLMSWLNGRQRRRLNLVAHAELSRLVVRRRAMD